MNVPVIRLATEQDAEALSIFAAATFSATYGALNELENMAAHNAAAFGVAQQGAELRNAQYTTLLQQIEGALAGYAQLRQQVPPSCVPPEGAIELHRFYVGAEWHGTGIAAQLMTGVVDRAIALGAKLLWLGVWERNPRAIAFYKKQLFRDVGATVFMVGPDRQTDRVLVRDLVTGAPA